MSDATRDEGMNVTAIVENLSKTQPPKPPMMPKEVTEELSDDEVYEGSSGIKGIVSESGSGSSGLVDMNANANVRPEPLSTIEAPVPTVSASNGAVTVEAVTPEDQIARIPDVPVAEGTSEDDGYEYDGPGIVVDPNEVNADKEVIPQVNPGLTPDAKDSISQYMASMDEDIEAARIAAIDNGYDPDDEDDEDKESTDEEPQMTPDQFKRAYEEAVIIIDKSKMGTIIDLTPEEHAKLARTNKIVLEEVETIALETIKTKKVSKKKIGNIIKRQSTSMHLTPIVLPASGYTAQMRGCSTYELISLMTDNNNPLTDAENRWSLIHSKLEDTSIGKLEFNEFLTKTAIVDYNMLLFGIISATYPDEDKIPMDCNKCKKSFDHPYSIKSLIRAEKMSNRLKGLVSSTVDSSFTERDAKKHLKESPLYITKTVKLPSSGYIVEFHIQSAYDLIYKTIKEFSELNDPKYNNASAVASVINRIFVPDEDEPGTYIEIDSPLDIAKLVYQFDDTDTLIITKQGEQILDGISFQFGFMNVKCPHCGEVTLSMNMELESLLFLKYQQAMNTKVE